MRLHLWQTWKLPWECIWSKKRNGYCQVVKWICNRNILCHRKTVCSHHQSIPFLLKEVLVFSCSCKVQCINTGLVRAIPLMDRHDMLQDDLDFMPIIGESAWHNLFNSCFSYIVWSTGYWDQVQNKNDVHFRDSQIQNHQFCISHAKMTQNLHFESPKSSYANYVTTGKNDMQHTPSALQLFHWQNLLKVLTASPCIGVDHLNTTSLYCLFPHHDKVNRMLQCFGRSVYLMANMRGFHEQVNLKSDSEMCVRVSMGTAWTGIALPYFPLIWALYHEIQGCNSQKDRHTLIHYNFSCCLRIIELKSTFDDYVNSKVPVSTTYQECLKGLARVKQIGWHKRIKTCSPTSAIDENNAILCLIHYLISGAKISIHENTKLSVVPNAQGQYQEN